MKIKIGNRFVGNDAPVFRTTEAGSVPFGIIKMTDLTKVVRSVRNDPGPYIPEPVVDPSDFVGRCEGAEFDYQY